MTARGIVSMNGFFMEGDGSWPPSETLEPLFYSFHISSESQSLICSPQGIDYLKRYEPIGCRDRGTMEVLRKYGVESFYSKCVSLTFARRTNTPVDGKIFLVDLSKAAMSIVPRHIRKKAVMVNQAKVRIPNLDNEARVTLAEHLLDMYAKHASLVITSKIHCAMPCIAMGIPVVFLYDKSMKNDYRVALLEDYVGINYVNDSWLGCNIMNRFQSGNINWKPEPVDIEQEKISIADGYRKAFEQAVERFAMSDKRKDENNA